jgi:hypothetical protein
MKTKTMTFLVFLLLSFSLQAETYHIGTGKAYGSIAEFTGWTSLQPGDTVLIHYRAEPYREHILLCQQGTQENPIVIQGVRGDNGHLPVISGDSAVIPPQFDGHLHSTIYQGYGIIYVHRSMADDPWGFEPEWIEIRNLEVRSATPEVYTFTNSEGVSGQAYPNGSSGIYIKTGNNILVEKCTIHDCGNGFDVQGVDAMAHNITVRNCHIYGNGRTDARRDREHNIYTEASGMTIEYCLIGRLRNGSGGSAIKDRSANTVIRYNKIYSGARALDLVEPENQSTHHCITNAISGDGMHEEPGFDTTWVYGNVIINGPSSLLYSNNMIHYGADNCPNASRSGTLLFYNNTVYTDMDFSHRQYSRLFDISTPRETVVLRNNVFYNAGSTHIAFAYSSSDTITTGTVNWEGGNWITSGYTDFYTKYEGVWNETVAPLEGENNGVLSDPANGDFSIPAGSPLLSAGAALPAEILAKHPVNKEYDEEFGFLERLTTNDIGAFESTTEAPVNTAPVIHAVSALTMDEDSSLTLGMQHVTAHDADGDILSFVVFLGDNYALDDDQLTVIPHANYNGSLEVAVAVTDGIDTSGVVDMTITVNAVNDSPEIHSTAPATAIVGETYTYTVVADDIDGDGLTYSLDGAPDGMEISANIITWLPPAGTSTSGEITLTVSDGELSDTETFTIAVSGGTGIAATETENFTLYPNPTNRDFRIRFTEKQDAICLSVSDFTGKVIANKQFFNTNEIDYEIEGTKGLYFVRIDFGGQTSTLHIIKE